MATVLVPSVLDPSLFIPDLKPRKKETILQELVAAALRAGAVRDPVLLGDTLVRRERWCGSGIGKGVAVPHARSLGVSAPLLVVARSRRGVEWGAPDRLRVQLVLLVLSPAELEPAAHLERVARGITATRLQRQRQRLLEAADAATVAELLRAVAP